MADWTGAEIDARRNDLPPDNPVVAGIDPDVSQDPDLYASSQVLLTTALPPVLAAAPPAMGTKARMIYAAQRLLGQVESPDGSNICPVSKWYNAQIAHIGYGPWCDMGITCEAYSSGNEVAVCGAEGRGFALTTAHAADFKRRGLWHYGADGMQDGDVVFFSWSRGNAIGDIDHVELVEKKLAGRWSTIGCNVANACRREIRDDTYVVGYGRPAYVGTPAGDDDVVAMVIAS
jgi:hypothetical protein